MAITGGCQCGAIRYELAAPPRRVSVCHCRDCQMGAGAPMVSWAIVDAKDFRLTKGMPVTHNSSGDAFRSFCGACGTGLFYVNETFLPGSVDIQSVTLDDPDAYPPGARVQMADAPKWAHDLHTLPAFERFQGPS